MNLWLSNDEGIYNWVRGLVAEITSETESTSAYWTLAESHKYNTADAIKAFVCSVEEDGGISPDLGATFAADLLGYALGQVDWHEIADAWLEV